VSSIADKFKKLLPANSGNDKARVDGSGSISLDDVDTVQALEEKTIRLARKDGAPAAPLPQAGPPNGSIVQAGASIRLVPECVGALGTAPDDL